MMETFKHMVNECIRIGLENNLSNLKKLSALSYHKLSAYDIQTKYRLTAISQACGRLSQRKKDIKKGKIPKDPYIQRPFLVSCYGFKVNGMLLSFTIRNRKFITVPLNSYVQSILSDPSIKVRSFTVTPTSLSLSMSKEIEPIKPVKVIGIDRNLRNVTIGNDEKAIQINTSEILKLRENANYTRASFRRNDHRIRKKIYSKIGNRLRNRVNQRFHKISKFIVSVARKENAAIVFENLKGIRKLYRKGNGQGKKYRRKLNSLPMYELERQIVYKASWNAIQVAHVDPRRTSMLCPICGGRLQEDRQYRRKLLCGNCGKSMDRDVVASMNIAHKGMQRFCISQGLAGEAMVQERGSKDPLILKVDASKLSCVV